MLTIGIGTGRCGTMSLAQLINGCKDCTVYHELRAHTELLPWKFDKQLALRKLKMLREIPGIVYGDIAFYYLNYIEFFIERVPDIRVIHIYREKSAVIRSFMNKTEGRNHWMPPNSKYRVDTIWDKYFPTYTDVATKPEAISRYYDEYLSLVATLIKKYPERILSIDVGQIDDKQQINKLFCFLNIPKGKRKFDQIVANKFISWREQLEPVKIELRSIIPLDNPIILVDQDQWRGYFLKDQVVFPLLEKNGEYWGPPPDDITAIRQIERLKSSGAKYIVFGWPSFWWLDYYSGMNRYLCSEFRCILRNDRLVVFDLRSQKILGKRH